MRPILDPAKRRKKPKNELPHLFGRGGRDRILLSLAVNGPMTVREVGRATGIDSHKAFDMVEALVKTGLVVKRNRAGGRKYAALNRNFPAWPELANLLEAIEWKFPVTRVAVPSKRWHLQIDATAYPSQRLDDIFQSSNRSRILLLVATAGEVVERDVCRLLGIEEVSALYALGHWHREGILRSDYIKGCRVVSLDSTWFAAHELRMLLGALVIDNDEYLALGQIARERVPLRLDRKIRRPKHAGRSRRPVCPGDDGRSAYQRRSKNNGTVARTDAQASFTESEEPD